MDAAQIYGQVRQHYGEAARKSSSKYSEAIARAFGYSEEQLAQIPEGSNLGLSCGNPLALASLREGEVVIDLGSGAGFDVFAAANLVGVSGRVIGVDMNTDMLARANKIKQESRKDNVEFVEANITDISVLKSGLADCIISNCVINLVPEAEKSLVFKEIFRLLKPGGRLAISDILAKRPLPDQLRLDAALYVGCIAGASMVSAYETGLRKAGFEDILIEETDADLNIYSQLDEAGTTTGGCCEPCAPTRNRNGCSERKVNPDCGAIEHESKPSLDTKTQAQQQIATDKLDYDLNQWVGSFKIYAVKS